MANAVSYTLAEIVARLGGELRGDGQIRIHRVASLEHAAAGSISFLANAKYRAQLATTKAAAVILKEVSVEKSDTAYIVAANPYMYFAKVSALLNPSEAVEAGVHASAVVHPSARVAASAQISAQAFVAADASIGARTVIGPGCRIGAGAVVGEDCMLYANVVIYHACVIGARAIIHAGAVVGADGFGFAPEAGAWVKIPQVGRVVVGNDVEIGAKTTIDRGAIEDTVIGDGVKLDNQIHIGHNVHIGAHTAIAACVGIAGSASIGRHCQIGGAAGILGHLEICDGVTVSPFSLVTKSIHKPGTYTGIMPLSEHKAWLKQGAQLHRLDELAERVAKLEKQGRQS